MLQIAYIEPITSTAHVQKLLIGEQYRRCVDNFVMMVIGYQTDKTGTFFKDILIID